MRRTLSLLVVAALSTLILAAAVPAASAKAPVVKTGGCSGTSTWKLTLKMDARRIEADSEIQTNTAGQVWRYRFSDNGRVFGRAHNATIADGSTSVTRLSRNHAGADVITVRSTNLTTGEVCTAKATF